MNMLLEHLLTARQPLYAVSFVLPGNGMQYAA